MNVTLDLLHIVEQAHSLERILEAATRRGGSSARSRATRRAAEDPPNFAELTTTASSLSSGPGPAAFRGVQRRTRSPRNVSAEHRGARPPGGYVSPAENEPGRSFSATSPPAPSRHIATPRSWTAQLS